MANKKIPYTKKTLGPKELLTLLKDHGLIINDDKSAYLALEKIGYYRLTGFCLTYKNKKIQNQNKFSPGTTLENVLALYYFDTDLRGIISRALGLLEVSIRTSICEKMCQVNNSHWYTDAKSYEVGKFQAMYEDAAKQVNFDLANNRPFFTKPDVQKNSARHLFLDHYYEKYNNPLMPPAWMLRECSSFGFWAKTYEALKVSDKKRITQDWRYPDSSKIDEVVFESWLRSLTILRNRCSHHARITNRSFPFEPALPRNDTRKLFEDKTDDLRTLIVIIFILTRESLPAFDWRSEVLRVFNSHKNVDIEKATGFKKEEKSTWEETKFWAV